MERWKSLQNALEILLDMEHVFLEGAGEDKDVIKVDEDKPIQHVTDNIIHQNVDHSRGVGDAKVHEQILLVGAGRVESSLPLVPLSYPHQVVGVS